jgi:hypothetical protein
MNDWDENWENFLKMIKILASYNKKLDKIFMKKCLSKCKKYFFNYSKRNFTVSKKKRNFTCIC